MMRTATRPFRGRGGTVAPGLFAVALLLLHAGVEAHSIASSPGAGGETVAAIAARGCRPRPRQLIKSSGGLRLEPDVRKRQAGTAAGEGATVDSAGGASAAGYRCDPNTCKLPTCHCADTKPPGGLQASEVPMFITLTADDAIQSYTLDALNALIGGRKNPNGCPVSTVYFNSLDYTNYSMVTEWYVAGHEIADHTITHVAQPSISEVSGNLIALNALAGIPFREIVGFRAPFLNYTRQTLEDLARGKFTYDSSATSGVPVTDPNTDAFWPYTLDNGLANDCTVDGLSGVCHGEPKLPGFWEIPMYSTFHPDRSVLGLMDPWLEIDTDKVFEALKATFTDHYNAQRQPFGLYSHPIHISTTYPGAPTQGNQRIVSMLNSFLDFAMANGQFQNVWMVTNKQLLAWMQNPVPASQLNTLPAFKCQQPNPPQDKICSGIPDKEAGLLQHCISDVRGDSLNDSPFYTCYGCPTKRPTPNEPNPPQQNSSGTPRTRINAQCDTPFWDPIAGKCLNSGYTDATRAIGPNGANLTSTGTTNIDGQAFKGGSGNKGDGYKTFGGKNAAGSSQGRVTAADILTAAFLVAAAVTGNLAA